MLKNAYARFDSDRLREEYNRVAFQLYTLLKEGFEHTGELPKFTDGLGEKTDATEWFNFYDKKYKEQLKTDQMVKTQNYLYSLNSIKKFTKEVTNYNPSSLKEQVLVFETFLNEEIEKVEGILVMMKDS